MKKLWILLLTLCHAPLVWSYPVTVDNCGTPLTINQKPQRAVVHDINMAEMAFALKLQPDIVGLSGITGWYKASAEFSKKQGDIPEIAPKYPNLENLLLVNADFLFAGWNYGLAVGGTLTPERLKEHGINTLLLTESCIHQNSAINATMDELLFKDILSLGKIFAQDTLAEQLVAQWRIELAQLKETLKNQQQQPYRVFLYDSGKDKPFTAGKYAIASAIIDAAHGSNIAAPYLATNWGTLSWENIALNDPEWIILLSYQNGKNIDETIKFLEAHPLMSQTRAVQQQHYILLRYEEITPGPANIESIYKIASQMYPDLFDKKTLQPMTEATHD